MAATGSKVARKRKLNVKQKRKVVKTTKKIGAAWRIWTTSLGHLWQKRFLFGIIMLVYLILYLLLIRGFIGFQLSDARQTIEEAIGAESGVRTATAMFGALLGTAVSSGAQLGSAYQMFLFVIFSLIIVWSLRQTYDGRRGVAVSGAFYQSTGPLVQYSLVLVLVILQLLPALIGLALYSLVVANGIAVGWLETVLWFLFLVIMLSSSIYMLSSSLLATYIVTLKGMRPMTSLKAAKKLVRFRRFMVIRKMLFFPFIMSIIAVIIFLPLVFWFAVAAEVTFILFSLLLLPLAHAYYYTLYRELM